MNESKRRALEYLEHQKKTDTEPEPLAARADCGKYGLSRENLQTELNRLNGRCSLCSRKIYCVLDHDHKTNKARGYICQRCNIRLSGVDNEQWLARALGYLKNPPLAQFYT